ncbi:class I SAM-dependent methyltransferase [Fimbriiglobus ruber]|uniref:Methyltransferase domain-containing protein n=1 Tax=Fimbriiglobus ruber TaxID=1908690 RepID=A0A225CZX0_9BACT|nr:class I SAM-dependent methyltransferase [Fimbriiglobus ruber]OWK34802.1 hypothetical protein FRUB_09644 [Fimbriiglobus ruber]
MLPRVLEPEVMDTAEEARDYDDMDHAAVNRVFVTDFLSFRPDASGTILDLGTGTAQIPIEFCRRAAKVNIVAVDAAEQMLAVAARNVASAGLQERIRLDHIDAKKLPYPDGTFPAVVSNSIVHHIPDPTAVFAEIARVCARGGAIFVRDLLRPDDEVTLNHLVDTYAAGANQHQRQMFAESLRAALTLAEVRAIVAQFGFPTESVTQTTDRHWTWAAVNN